MKTSHRIIGIDPGYGRLGVGIIEGSRDVWKALHYDCVTTSARDTLPERLYVLHATLSELIDAYKPDCAAIEQLFFYKNVKTAIDVGQARGVLLLTCAEKGLPIREFTPLQVKQALVGYGRAEKRQVQYMVKLLLGIDKRVSIQDDAADALAVALTCRA